MEPAYYNRQEEHAANLTYFQKEEKNVFPDRRFYTNQLLKKYWKKTEKVLRRILFCYWIRAVVKFGRGGDTSKIIKTGSLWEACYVYVNPVHGKYFSKVL